MTPLWAVQAAERFWAAAGGPPPNWPRDLRRAVALALPLAVIDLPRLRVTTMAAWLAQRGIALPITERDRSVRACLLVRAGAGLIFLEGADPEDERRFSLAHEVAHFLVEYVLPRARATDRLGPEILSVLDGRRALSPAERVDALLAGVPLEIRIHLMDRTPDGRLPELAVSAAERRADALALEMLAPIAEVRSRLTPGLAPPERETILRDTFGLPAAVARAYARQVWPAQRPTSPLIRSLVRQRDT